MIWKDPESFFWVVKITPSLPLGKIRGNLLDGEITILNEFPLKKKA